ncbi:MAG: immune inhibitor A, partial [Anaerolineales bacterium]|nr:immune inhibitor A [Anaerolineales bacterium]
GHQNIHNAEAYVAQLPSRLLIDPAKVAAGASPDHVWWSNSGNDFGCAPSGGHNLDIFLPELATLPAGTQVTVEFNSYFDIEWDYDYGFVLVSTDGGANYQSVASDNGYTTDAAQNPNANSCQQQYGNGLTGTSGSYAAGTSATDRLLGNFPDGGFLPDSYDLTFAAGSSTVLRFSYATDPGLARPGWFIDDLKVTADGVVIYESDFEEDHDDRMFNGGCQEDLAVAQTCTVGWTYVSAADGSPADHAYYMEMRDRSGFDFEGKGENDRDPIAFEPGLLLVITDEARGYGNVGADNPPVQSPVDSRPESGSDTPNLNDAAFKLGDSYSDFGALGWVDNYSDPSDPLGADAWRHLFDCLSFTVDSMSGHTTIGPDTVPGDLIADVTFNMGDGCRTFNYGLPDGSTNMKPTAVAQARPTTANTGEAVTFDGSASYDDITPTSSLTYEWDFDNDGTIDATGQSVQHAYSDAGVYTARLVVTDGGGLSDEATVVVTVNETVTPTATATNTPTATSTPNPTATATNTPDPTATATNTPDPTATASPTPDPTATASPTPDPDDVTKTTGGGWLLTTNNKRLNYSFTAQEDNDGWKGNLQVKDRNANVEIDIDTITFLGEIQSECGPLNAAPLAAEFQGSGTFNGTSATFRVCVQDNDEPGTGIDIFYITCLTGCVYNSSDSVVDDVIDGGNIQVHHKHQRTDSGNGNGNGNGNSGGSSNAASTVRLGPMFMTTNVPGQPQLLTVLAYDAEQNLMPNADVTLTQVSASGVTQTFTALTDATGTAVFTVVGLSQYTEYVAISGTVESNYLGVAPVLALP